MNAVLHTVLAATTQLFGRLWHRCRNQRCCLKLPAPVENEHHGFCTSGCHASFYRSRCLVCEEPMRRKNERQRFGSGHRTCQAEYRRFPHVFEPPRHSQLPQAGFSETKLRNAHSTGLKTGIGGDRSPFKCLARYGWGGDPDHGDHSLYDGNGLTVARIVLQDDGRYHLRTPATWPRVSWPDLVEARRHAEALALVAIPVDPKLAARIRRDNETPLPLGLPLNLQPSQAAAILSDWKPVGTGAAPPIPDFLRRHPIYRDAVAALRSAA